MKADGKVTSSTRQAIRILTREGREAAFVREDYTAGSCDIRELKAWILPPSGAARAYGQRESVDRSMVDNDVYDEARARTIDVTDDAEVGAVFGSESLTEEVSPTAQFIWRFQDRLPVVLSRLIVIPPAGWGVRASTFHHAPLEPRIEGASHAWTLTDLPYLETEPASPPLSCLAPRVAVTLLPPAEKKEGATRRFESWGDVARWLSELAEPRARPSPELTARSQTLVRGLTRDWDRIEAVARYVQNVNYISIQTGIARGGGFQPRAAADVFAKSYGDCKDKANLMRTMLGAIGVTSRLVYIYSGDPEFVREEWPSPHQFNHCILAVATSDSAGAPSAITHPELGRLLFFDPTDTATPLGDLPMDEQGSLALVAAPNSGVLVRVPLTDPKTNRTERTLEGVLGPDGSLKAALEQWSTGQAAAEERRTYRRSTQSEYTKAVEIWISRHLPGARVDDVVADDRPGEGRFGLRVGFSATQFARPLAGGLLALKPVIVSRIVGLELNAEKPRRLPVRVPSYCLIESSRFLLPEGLDLETPPDSVRTDSPYGSYRAEADAGDGYFRFTREIVLRRATVPAEESERVREFLERIYGTERSSVVLAPR